MIVAGRGLGKRLIDAERQSAVIGRFGFLDCRVGGWPSASALSLEGFASPVALDVHLQDRGVVDEAVDGGERHGLIGEDLAPFAEGLIGGDQHGSPLVARGDQLEQDAGLGLILGDVGDVVEDEQVVAVELGDRGFRAPARGAPPEAAGRDRWCGRTGRASRSRRGRDRAPPRDGFCPARRAEQQEVGAVVEPGVARRQRHHLRLRDHRHGFEVEGGEGLAGGQAGLGHMPLDAAAAAVGELVLGEGCQEAGRGPALLVGLRGEFGPDRLDARQAQFGQQQFDARGVDGGRGRSCRGLPVEVGRQRRTAASSS